MPAASKGAKQKKSEVQTGVAEVNVLERVESRISQIEGKEKITPWNKAKLMAFKEVRDMLVPPPAETPAAPEPETATEVEAEPAPEPSEEVVEQSYAPLEDEA